MRPTLGWIARSQRAFGALVLAVGLGTSGCAQIGAFFEELGDDAEEAGEEVEDEIDDATSIVPRAAVDGLAARVRT